MADKPNSKDDQDPKNKITKDPKNKIPNDPKSKVAGNPKAKAPAKDVKSQITKDPKIKESVGGKESITKDPKVKVSKEPELSEETPTKGKKKGKSKPKKSKAAPKPVKEPGVWGIDLGQCGLKAVRVEFKDGKATATAFDYHEHPKILSQPDADPDQLVREALETFLDRNDLKGDQVVVSVPGQSGLARFVKLPPVEEKKIGEIVRFEAKQQIPFPLEEVVWDFQKISKGESTDGFAMDTEIGLFAMKREMVNRALSQYQEVNIEIDVIQMAPLALANFVTYEMLNKTDPNAEGGAKECVVALDIGADNSNLIITDGNRIIWQRPIPLGGNHFTRALTKELKLTFAKAEHVKRNAIKSPDLRKILTALRPVLNDFVNEVQRSLGYFTNTHRDAEILYMVGLGNAFRLPGLQKFLQEKLQLEVRKLTKLENLAGEEVTNAPQFTENILSFAVAYGLALQGLKKTKLTTNLLPEEIVTERKIRKKKPWAVATAAVMLLGVAFLGMGMAAQYSVLDNKEIDSAIQRGEQAKGIASKNDADFKSFETQSQGVKETINRIASGTDQRYNWILLFDYINNAIPQPGGIPMENGRYKVERKYWPYYLKIPHITRIKKAALQDYYNSKAEKAYGDWLKIRNNLDKKLKSDSEQKREDTNIKPYLTQVNIEGISCMYSDDLKIFFDNITREKLILYGLSDTELKNIKDQTNLPTKGWVFEIRGYTYHFDRSEFVQNTFVENLAMPHKVGIIPPDPNQWEGHHYYETLFYPLVGAGAAPSDAGGDASNSSDPSSGQAQQGGDQSKSNKLKPEDFKKRLSYVFMYRPEEIKNPEPGHLYTLNKSYLPELLSNKGQAGPGGDIGSPQGGGAQPADAGATGGGNSRDGWSPIGQVASAVIGGAGGAGSGGGRKEGGGKNPPNLGDGIPNDKGEKTEEPANDDNQPPLYRTEFFVLFVWEESTLEGSDSAPTGGAAAAAP